MPRKYYAGYNPYGTQFVYDASNGWSVYVFDSKADRDYWVSQDIYVRNNLVRETITRKNALKITRDRTAWIETLFHVNYHTGAGNFTYCGTLRGAEIAASKGATYTQEPISITDEFGNEVSYRQWVSTLDGLGETEDPIRFGAAGYYGDWQK